MGEFSRIYKTDLSDRQIMSFWHHVEQAGRERAIAFDSPPLTPLEFCRWMRQPDVHPWWVLFNGDPVGLSFLTQKAGKAARIHFLTLPQGVKRTKLRRLSVVRAFGLYAMGSMLWERNVSGGFILNTLIGLTPICNKEAVKFIHTLGAVDCGVVPDACYYHDTGENVAGVATVYTRETVPEWTTEL